MSVCSEQKVCERDIRLQHAVEETHRLQEALLSDRTSTEGRQEAQSNHSHTNRQKLHGVEKVIGRRAH